MKKIALKKETVRKLTEIELEEAQGGKEPTYLPCKATVTVEWTVVVCGGGPSQNGHC